MAQTPVFSTQSSIPLPDVLSTALNKLFETARPGIVQIHVDQRGGGTGIVWSSDGLILTNNHVVAHDQARVHVHFTDGRTVEATVIQRNPRLDLALLKVNGDSFNALSVGNSSVLRTGEWVFAIGHPWGQRWAMTAGIVSTISTMKLAQELTTQYIKSDVLLAPGNSGGPLLNADGQVIGINAMILGGDLSVAIPSNVVSSWLANLPQQRSILGIKIQMVELPETLRQQLQPQQATGVVVVDTTLRQAEHHDLLVGDILLTIAEKPVKNTAELRHILENQTTVGGTVPVQILRGGVIVTIDIALVTVEKAA